MSEALARQFHETYERLAPQFGYETRQASAVPWEQVPEKNRQLMIAVCAQVVTDIAGRMGELEAACKLALDYLTGPITGTTPLLRRRNEAIEALKEALAT